MASYIADVYVEGDPFGFNGKDGVLNRCRTPILEVEYPISFVIVILALSTGTCRHECGKSEAEKKSRHETNCENWS